MAVALMHNASDITMNTIADANAAGVVAREYAGRDWDSMLKMLRYPV